MLAHCPGLACCRTHAGHQWRTCYERTAAALARSGGRPWAFDAGPVFSYMDAFLQRCTDLLEVCEAQLQFAADAKLPVFGGTRGAEVEKNIADIQAAFRGLLAQLKGLSYDLLDVTTIQ
jgi:dynein heavy chain